MWYAMLPFGLCSAPKIFNAVADAFEWCIAKAGVQVLYHYLDDFVVLGPPGSEKRGRTPADIAEGMLQPRCPSGTRETGRAKYLHNLPGHS